MADALTVTRLVRKMRNLLEIELGEVWVEGEVSNLRRQASGHFYFTLKDEGAQLSCVMFRGNVSKAKVKPDNGMKVRLRGEVSVYEARGSVQLVVRECEGVGEGELQAKFEALKRKLDTEGLFSSERKKVLPSFPKRVGLVTSGTGAALQDMLNVLGRRAPWVELVLYPVQVQGVGAEKGIARAIEEWGSWEAHGLPEVDVIIVGRGGGSLEDLWNFNEECVARAIYDCVIPVVSAVGHEIDFTISDFVADMRAPTPSAAAELVVPDGEELRARLSYLANSMERRVAGEVRHFETTLSGIRRGPLSRSVERVLSEPMQRLAQVGRDLGDVAEEGLLERRREMREMDVRLSGVKPEKVIERRLEQLQGRREVLEAAVVNRVARLGEQLLRQGDLLRTLGPVSAFERGFSVTLKADGSLVRGVGDLVSGEKIYTRLGDGEVGSVVE